MENLGNEFMILGGEAAPGALLQASPALLNEGSSYPSKINHLPDFQRKSHFLKPTRGFSKPRGLPQNTRLWAIKDGRGKLVIGPMGAGSGLVHD